jgi:hypothetical protein
MMPGEERQPSPKRKSVHFYEFISQNVLFELHVTANTCAQMMDYKHRIGVLLGKILVSVLVKLYDCNIVLSC